MDQPNIIPVSFDGVELYQLWQDFPYPIKGKVEIARAGFVLDGASVPRLFWPFLPKDGTHRAEALKHDWGYDGKGLMENGLTCTKAEIDTFFYQGLLSLKTMSPLKCEIVYEAVHLFGGKAWNEGDGTRLVLPVGSLAPSRKPRKKRFLRHIYDNPV